MQIEEGTLDLLCATLAPALNDPALLSRSYPLVPLEIGGEPVMRSFRTVVLRNAVLSVTVLPELGGRILRITDLASGDELLGGETELVALPAELRGASLPAGITWSPIDGSDAESLGPVDYEIREDESGVGVLVIHQLLQRGPLSVHLSIALEPDAAVCSVVMSAFNLSDRSIAVSQPGLRFPAPASGFCSGEWSSLDAVADGWKLAIRTPGEVQSSPGRLELGHGQIGPFDTLTCKFEIAAVRTAGEGPVRALGRSTMLFLPGESLQISAISDTRGSVELIASDGASFQAPVSLPSGKLFSVNLAGGLANPQELRYRNSDGELEWTWPPAEQQPSFPLPPVDLTKASSDNHPVMRFGRTLLRARTAIERERWIEADEAVNEALAWHGENPIAWWLKSAVGRHLPDLDSATAAEPLTTAHYLAPLEPLLRAEAFLGQSPEMGREASPLVAPLSQNPEAQVHVGAILIEWGFHRDAARWLDECLRHRPWPNVRLLYAYLLLTRSRMEFEAATQIRELADQPIDPPFPWRGIERTAIDTLAERFPDDERLARLARLVSGVAYAPA